MRPGRAKQLPAPAMQAPSTSTLRAPLSLHIDRLVLDGLPIANGELAQLQASLVAELTSLFASGRLHAELRDGVSLPRLRLDEIRLRDAAAPEQIGRQIARVLHRGVSS
jgi:hypothetical protein